MNLQEIREQINAVDEQLVDLFVKRMQIAADVAAYKKENGMPVLDSIRERAVLQKVCALAPEEMQSYTKAMYQSLMGLSRTYQNSLLGVHSTIDRAILDTMAATPALFPTGGLIACQGIEGAYSQMACDRFFSGTPNILYFRQFENVFEAVENGGCRYGVLPIENNTYGSVGTVYDLMRRHRFHIVRSLRLPIHHTLLAKPGAALSGIREIVSHEQALGQCSSYLRSLPNVKITVCENTAVAARRVAESERTDLAAVSSPNCAKLYGLQVLEDEIANSDFNFTRFICIAKTPEIYPGANRISLMLRLPHETGSLAMLLSKFHALGINVRKLESRPIPGTDFAFQFYLDLEADPCDARVRQTLGSLENEVEQLVVLGCYAEVV